MLSLQKFLRFLVITSCLFAAGATYIQAEEHKKSPAVSSDMNPMMGMMNPHMMNSMMNPMAYMNMMSPMIGMGTPMMGMMNPMMNPMAMMGPMMGMGAPMMGSMMNPMGMMNPMMGMNMMYPMMGMMGPMMGGMGGMSIPGTGAHGGNPMGQMPGGQMMDPKQYEQWFKQWSESMKNFAPQNQPQANQ
jgi:hypothetical protein